MLEIMLVIYLTLSAQRHDQVTFNDFFKLEEANVKNSRS